MTGAAVAWRLAAAGVKVVVLDAKQIGHGSTAASTALLMQEPDEDFARLAGRYGSACARRIWELSRTATRELRRTVRRLRIPCSFADADSLYYTLNPAALPHLRHEHRLRRTAGVGGAWLTASALKRATGFDGAGAIRTRANAQVDPYRACVGFAAAAGREGARIFEASAVTRIDTDRSHVVAKTTRGAVRASHVIVATGYATPFVKPLMARFRMWNTYVLTTAPMRASMRHHFGATRAMLWDTERPYHYARWTRDGRLMMGGADRPLVTGRQRRKAFHDSAAALRAYFEARWPSLAEVPIEYAWEGLFATTPDGLPYIGPHRRYPRHLFALGYGGNGMTFGFLAARLLLEQLQGQASPDHRLFGFNRQKNRELAS